MSERTILICDRCRRDALRIVELDGQALCPRCTLAVIDDAVRSGDVTAVELHRREQPASKVARMRGRR